MKRYAEMTQLLTNATSKEAVNAVIRDVCDEFGLENYLYGGLIAKSPNGLSRIVLNAYPAGWYERYELKYMVIDPVLHLSYRNILPVVWNDIPTSLLGSIKIRRAMDERRDFGMRAGATVPVHGAFGEKGLVSFATTNDTPRARSRLLRAIPVFQTLVPYIHEAVCRIERNGVIPPENGLSDREKECLLWSAEGKTSWEIGTIIGISERTVIFHLQNAMKKLKCGSRIQAVARATALRLIMPLY